MSLANIHSETVTSTERLLELDKLVMATELVAFDSETNGLHRFRKGIGFSFALSEDFCFYVPLLHWVGGAEGQFVNPWKDDRQVREILKKWFSDKSKKWIGHNIPFDAIVVHNEFNVWITDQIFSDTKSLHHTCISEESPHSLKSLAVKYISPDADQSQQDLGESVKANGGAWTKQNKEIWRGDVTIVGKYACMDAVLTYRLHQRFYPELEKQGFTKLWKTEAHPLLKVIIELNSAGLEADIPYFENLKEETEQRIVEIEDSIYEAIKDKAEKYEYERVLEDVTITKRSVLGKLLLADGAGLLNDEIIIEGRELFIINWYKQKKGIARIFNLDSGDDKAYLLYDILQYTCPKRTKSGKPAVDKKTLDQLLEDDGIDHPVVKQIQERAKARKLVSTYILPILEGHVNGRVYPDFNPTGTTSGRFSSSGILNFQTLPRDNTSVKKGLVAEKGRKFVNADFSSLEPRCFVSMSDTPELKKVYQQENLDLYSQIYIDMWNAGNQYSADETSPKYLKKLNPGLRNIVKPFVLASVYGVREYRLSSIMGVTPEEARSIIDRYFLAYPNLKRYMTRSQETLASKHEIRSVAGRRRRSYLIPVFQRNFPKISIWSGKEIIRSFDYIMENSEIEEYVNSLKPQDKPKTGKDLAYLVRSELNNACNFPIQSLAASITNAATIEFYERAKKLKLDARIVLQVHDEITLSVKEEQVEQATSLLKQCMEHNFATELIDVPMRAIPVICSNLAESK